MAISHSACGKKVKKVNSVRRLLLIAASTRGKKEEKEDKMNCYTQVTAAGTVKGVSVNDFQNLKEKLENTGLDAELWDIKRKGKHEKGDLYLFGEEYFDESLFIEKGCLKTIGKILTKAKVPYLDFGISFCGNRFRPSSAGGGKFRIYADGHLAWAELKFPKYTAKKS